ncbi:MAG: hypothetical protein H7Z75_10120 [Ferruginibacter sp.]|nr:hypothetical protein [Cytophagales bacterium]
MLTRKHQPLALTRRETASNDAAFDTQAEPESHRFVPASERMAKALAHEVPAQR